MNAPEKKTAKAKKKEPEEKVMIGANRLESFKPVTLNRKDIKGADYNPRKMTEANRKKLRKLLKTHGMVQPIVVNKRTMRIVGGHQRVSIMDSELRREDYELSVAMIDVDEADEVKINVSLNNQSVMGEWDLDLLESIKIDLPDIDFQNDLGFDQIDIESMFYDSEAFFPPKTEVATPIVAKKDFDESGDELDSDGFESDSPDEQNVREFFEEASDLDKLKAAKRAYREEAALENKDGTSHLTDDDDYTVDVVFNSNQEKWNFMSAIGKKLEETHIKPAFLYDLESHSSDMDKPQRIGDNKVTIVFTTNSEKKDFMKKMRMKPEETLIKPEMLKEIQDGKISLMEG
jgi:hypothetical protein